MEEINTVYEKLIDKMAQTNIGLEKDSEWSRCLRQNYTAAECPIADYADKTDYNMVIATHNPSNLPTKEVQIKVPNDNFVVEKFNGTQWVATNATVICFEHQ